MRAALLLAIVPFVASASQAADEFGKMLLMARQDQSFVPVPGGQVSCNPPNNVCGRYCQIVSKGDVCCPENYVCPGEQGGSFCLAVVDGTGRCCPNGEDPNTCARNNGIALPNKFIPKPPTPTPVAPTTTTLVNVSTPPTSTEPPIVEPPTTIVPPSATPPAPSTTPPFVIIATGNATIPASTGLGAPGAAPSPIQPFTGAAARCVGFGGVSVGMIVGAVGWIA